MNEDLKAKIAKIKPDVDVPLENQRALAEEKVFGEKYQIRKLQLEHKQNQHKLGIISKIIGTTSEKPGNIAAIVLLLSLVALLVAIFVVPIKESHFSTLTGIITLTLGYLFGKTKS